MAKLIYGCGLRLQECVSLRIKDVDIEQGSVVVRQGKGNKGRRTVLAESLREPGLKIDVQAVAYTLNGSLLAVLRQYFCRHRGAAV